MAQTIIQTNNLSVGYGQQVIWEKANLNIKSGQFIALLGPNGAGKTTLFRLLLGLIKPKSGKLEIKNNSQNRQLTIGYVPQKRPTDSESKLQAVEYVRLGLIGRRIGFCLPALAKQERQKAIKALQSVGGSHLAYKPISQLSGGEAQRIFLAQALVANPDLLLLDEPLANLDLKGGHELIKLIKNLIKTQSITVILIAHDINPLLSAIDRIIYIANGQVASGQAHQIINSQSLSKLYNYPIEVVKDSRGRLAVLGIEEAIHHE